MSIPLKRLLRASLTAGLAAACLVCGLGALAWLRVGQTPAPCHAWDVPVDVALVLSGGPDYRRTRRAVALYKSGRAGRLGFSGAGHGGDSAERLAREARRLGVPENNIVVEDRARSTVENFRNSCALAALDNADRIAIVTDQFHAYRAWLTAKRQCANRSFCSAPAPLPLTRERHVSEAQKLWAYQLLRRANWW